MRGRRSTSGRVAKAAQAFEPAPPAPKGDCQERKLGTAADEGCPRCAPGLALPRPAILHSRALKKRISTVILDFGGVLGLPQDPKGFAEIASLCGLSIPALRPLYQRDRLELDRGSLPAAEYWRRILVAAGVTADPALLARIDDVDSWSWTRMNRRMLEWTGMLRARGYRTAILSNMPTDKLAYMRRDGEFAWLDDFDAAFFSCDYLPVKPEPAFYRLCLEKLGEKAERCLFLDDSMANVEAARALGINALHFRSAAEAAPELSERWGLPVDVLEETVDERG
jgi:putative hydrolase of the HAD superfamily